MLLRLGVLEDCVSGLFRELTIQRPLRVLRPVPLQHSHTRLTPGVPYPRAYYHSIITNSAANVVEC